ncbi:hypothetical protein C2845_PM04G16080 [Panicum miliaceum]|uniref:Uncharacterized protein n=1 Tax=Panicum miliaceum TaxID=4540 RepID=A0A3L6QRW1_PANMI|nr:hypothetical protein C2845_PM04G16080 [Panicum miliaceum]
MWTATKNKLKKLNPSSSRRSQSSASSQDNMLVDLGRRDSVSQEDMTPAVHRNCVRILIRVLTMVDQIIAQNEYEREALDLLKKKFLPHKDFCAPLHYQNGPKTRHDPCLQLCRLQYELTTKELSVALGFSKKCLLDPNALVKDYHYDRTTWWNEISEEPVSSKNSIVSIHNPTLRLLAKWFCMVVHPRSDLRLCILPELQCLFAMAKKIKFSPVMSMLAHWKRSHRYNLLGYAHCCACRCIG